MISIIAPEEIKSNPWLAKVIQALNNQEAHFDFFSENKIYKKFWHYRLAWLSSYRSKIILGLLAKLHPLKLVWLEEPDFNYAKQKYLQLFLKLSRRANLVCFSAHSKDKLLQLGVEKNNITLIRPGIGIEQDFRQDNIFTNIAKAHQPHQQEAFTIGTLANLSKPNQIENILQAIQQSLMVIKNPQLIVIGDGRERKNLIWLSRRLGLEQRTWFVGQQDNLNKWLETLDLFITGDDRASLANIKNLLLIGSKRIPIIAFPNENLYDILTPRENVALVPANNSELLTQSIIESYKDRYLVNTWAKNLQKDINNNFKLEDSVNKFKELCHV